MGKNKFQPTEPFVSKKYKRYPAPRGARRAATVFLVVLVVLLVALVIGIISDSSNREMSNSEAIAKIDKYRTGDMVDVHDYLIDRGYEAVGEPDAFVYRRGNATVSIQNYGDYVTIGDGKGTSRQFGLGPETEVYICRFGCADTDPDIEVFYDLHLSSEALADIVRWSYR